LTYSMPESAVTPCLPDRARALRRSDMSSPRLPDF
jgi:hypothetical protein